MELITYPDRDLLMMSLADRTASELGQALRVAGRASLCVPGGTTPGPVFKTLAEVDLAWRDIAVFLNDERWLGEDSPRSNTRLLKETLLQSKASEAKLIPLFNGANTPEEGIPDLTDGLLPHLPITVLLLGMGADMHTASLFPDGDNLNAALSADAPPLMAMRAANAGEPRITLTAPVLKAALHCHILITGREKRAALERAADLPEDQAPIATVLKTATIHWAE
jgi:6-phosphogluconolactonase